MVFDLGRLAQGRVVGIWKSGAIVIVAVILYPLHHINFTYFLIPPALTQVISRRSLYEDAYSPTNPHGGFTVSTILHVRG